MGKVRLAVVGGGGDVNCSTRTKKVESNKTRRRGRERKKARFVAQEETKSRSGPEPKTGGIPWGLAQEPWGKTALSVAQKKGFERGGRRKKP